MLLQDILKVKKIFEKCDEAQNVLNRQSKIMCKNKPLKYLQNSLK